MLRLSAVYARVLIAIHTISCADLGGRSEGMNRQQVTLVVAGALIAAAITLTNDWTATPLPPCGWTAGLEGSSFAKGFVNPGLAGSCPARSKPCPIALRRGRGDGHNLSGLHLNALRVSAQ